MNGSDIFIYDAVRTPRAKGRPAKKDKPGGALADIPPHRLVSTLVDAIDLRNPGTLDHVRRLSLGCVGQVGPQGGHIALVSRLVSRLNDDIAVRTLNNYCVSGLSAIFDSALWLQAGMEGMALAGGVESLSQVGFLADGASYYTDPDTIQTLKWAPPVMGAELIATIEGFSKSEIDQLTYRSHQRAQAAWDRGFYDDHVIAVTDQDGNELIRRDALIRADLTLEKLGKMPPAFAKQGKQGFDDMMLQAYPALEKINHIHSIANCPGMADGAALVLLGSRQAGEELGLKPLARIVDFLETADDPILQLTAGLKAMDQLLARNRLQARDIDRYEFMEAFAAVPLKFERDCQVDPDLINVNGGHLAMGHPMGATGCILTASLLSEIVKSGSEFGMVITQAGGGIGAAMLISKC